MMNQKKPFYKKWWFILIAVFFALTALGALQDDDETVDIDNQTAEKTETPEVSKNPVVVDPVPEPTIDTSVFEYATDAEVTDAITINKHVTVKLTVSTEAKPGMAVQHVLTQSFDFLQQEDVAGAETVTILITQDGKKIVQYTVNKTEFKPNETEPMGHLVLEASEIEMMSPEVEEFGKTMGWPQ